MAKLCIALDTHIEKALSLIEALAGLPIVFKVGPSMILDHHRRVVDAVKERGFELFLDLKLHDIPNTVALAVESAERLSADYLTLHLSSGYEALKAAVEVRKKIKLLGVALLTSLDEDFLRDVGVCLSKDEYFTKLMDVGIKAGIDGFVCSVYELPIVKERGFMAVVPGVRIEGDPTDDQKRVATLREAVEGKADMVVVGRSILRAEDPIKRVEEILHLLTKD